MLFSSLIFLIWFMPASVLIHALLPARARNGFLLAASVFFYAWGEIRYVPLVLASMLLNYMFGRMCAGGGPEKRRAALAGSLAVNVGALLYYKYAAFLMTSIGLGAAAPETALPLGISFYTFQTQAYVIDVYRKRTGPEPNFVDYAAYILLFPQLIAGPIVLYTDVRKELKSRVLTPRYLESGATAFAAGLASKVLLANPLGALSEEIRALSAPSSAAAWLGVLAFGLQIYFDFAGYSMMAAGMGRMMGFKFPRNFDHPYASRSVREFWRRWHMTLGAWFSEYVYIPMGGNRAGPARASFNLLVVWALTGLWHGASWNFLLWGLWFFAFLTLERYAIGGWLERHRRAARAYALLAVFAGWPLFMHQSASAAWENLKLLFSFAPGTDWRFPLRNNAVLLLAAALACSPAVMDGLKRTLRRNAALRTAAVLGALSLCVAGLVGESHNPFLYFRF